MEALAQKLKIRIALPRGDRPAGARYYQWNKLGLESIEARAAKACGGAKLEKPRALVGFSNGAMKTLRLGKMSCEKLGSYSLILSMGSPVDEATKKCPGQRQVKWQNHSFPTGDKVLNLLNQAKLRGDATNEKPSNSENPQAEGGTGID